MKTVPHAKPPVKPTIKLICRPADGRPGIVGITLGKVSASYYLIPLPADFGTAFSLSKFEQQGGESYDVLLSDDGKHSCECLGFLRWGKCKHLAAVQDLLPQLDYPTAAQLDDMARLAATEHPEANPPLPPDMEAALATRWNAPYKDLPDGNTGGGIPADEYAVLMWSTEAEQEDADLIARGEPWGD